MTNERVILTVSELNRHAKACLEQSFSYVTLIGEISNFTVPSSGHWYFSLKDSQAQVRCAMFRGQNLRTGFVPTHGQEVMVTATVTLYEARGEYQLIVQTLQLAGEGRLQQKFLQLKEKLLQEGLFDPAHKKPIPSTIRTVGVITSSTGAALHDICTVLKRRDPNIQIIIYPTLVQGNTAAPQIARMIAIANQRNECDLLIIGRGGGSLEDLWPFNEEIVARAIFNSALPTLSAVGHETDITIADFVADLRAATPSAAAELISRDQHIELAKLQAQENRLHLAMDYFIIRLREQIARTFHRLDRQHPSKRLSEQKAALINYQNRLSREITAILHTQKAKMNTIDLALSQTSPLPIILRNKEHLTHIMTLSYRILQQNMEREEKRIQRAHEKLGYYLHDTLDRAHHHYSLLCAKLNAVSPLATLTRGYSVTLNKNRSVVTSAKQLAPDDVMVTRLKKGKVTSRVLQVDLD